MHVALLSTGSRGDVQPLIALALGLLNVGYKVSICASPNHEKIVVKYGIEFYPIGVDTQKLLEQFKTGKGDVGRLLLDYHIKTNQDAVEVCLKIKPDFIMFHQAITVGHLIAEKLKIHAIEMSFAFWFPFEEYPSYMPSNHLHNNPYYNIYTSLVSIEGSDRRNFDDDTKEYKKYESNIEIPRIGQWYIKRQYEIPLLLSITTDAVTRPSLWTEPKMQFVNNWFLNAKDEKDWKPDPALEQFLSSGPAPIYIGFGSMFAEDSKQVFDAVMTALEHTKQRAIVSAGWSNFVDEAHIKPEQVHVVGDVPHSWLFKHCTAVVHHGGAGSTAAGLRAGKPSIIVPHIVDQFFWGHQIEEIGVGPKAIPIGDLTSDKLIAAFEVRLEVLAIMGTNVHAKAIRDPKMQEKAAELGAKVRERNGVQETIEIIKRMTATPRNWSQPQILKQKFSTLYQITADDPTKATPESYYRMAQEFHEQKLDNHVIAWAYYALEQKSSLTEEFKALVHSLLNLTNDLTEEQIKDKLHSVIFA